jgi:hypothetical protein
MKFRNYLPHDEQLRGGKLAPVSLPKFEDPISAETAEPKEVEVQLWCSQFQELLLVLLARQNCQLILQRYAVHAEPFWKHSTKESKLGSET